ncbi:MAG: hypothetical protein KDD82_20995 [Planctomycetes bacterium]|nr:hypothetical protein [Planctomycetota bacterium]
MLALSSAAGAQEPDEFTSVRLADVVEQLAKEAKREIRVDPRLRDEEVLVGSEDDLDMSWRKRLEFAVLDLLDGELQEIDGVLHVAFVPKLDFSGAVRLGDALQAVAEATGRELVLDPSVHDRTLVLGVRFLRWPDALRALAYAGQVTVETSPTRLTVTPLAERPPAPEGLVRRERPSPLVPNDEGPRMALSLKGETLREVARRLGGVVPGVAFLVPPWLPEAPLSLELPEAPWRRTLAALAAATDTTLEENDGVIHFHAKSFLHARGADVGALLPAIAEVALESWVAGAEVHGSWDCDYSGWGTEQFAIAAGEANGVTAYPVENDVVLLVGASKEPRQPEVATGPLTWDTLPQRVRAWSLCRDRGFALIDQASVSLAGELTVSGQTAVLREIHEDSLVFECGGERRVVALPTR